MTVAKLLIHKYRLCNARINQLIRYVKEHPKALSATFIYAAFVWPLLLVIALTFITLFLSIGISATTLTALFAPSLVIFLQTAVVIWSLSYARCGLVASLSPSFGAVAIANTCKQMTWWHLMKTIPMKYRHGLNILRNLRMVSKS